MDLGLRGRKALVCAASKGLGKACAMALAREGVDVIIAARGRETLEATAAEIRSQAGAKVTAVAADVTSEEGRKLLLAACPDPDILVNNAGGPPPGSFHDWSRDDWIKALDANMLSAIELIKATSGAMIERGFGRIVNITSSAVKAPILHLGLSNGARSGLTGFVAGLAREFARSNVTVNNLLPGAFETDRVRKVLGAEAQKSGQDLETVARARMNEIPMRRFGRPEEFGALCAYVCSSHAGYLTGQNLLLDGGAYPGTF
jgi:3-oxoacyl-[acyl-carrier protein] reductase